MAIVRRSLARDYPFPQADSPDRVLDVIDIVYGGPLDDAQLGEQMQIHPRQGRYYADAAAFLGLVRLSGGYWRPEKLGVELACTTDAYERMQVVARAIVTKPVFAEAAAYWAQHGVLPERAAIEAMIRHDTPTLNATTAERRGSTVARWLQYVIEQAPDAMPVHEPVRLALVA